MNIYDKIERLHNLFQQGSITEQEYNLKKQILLRKNALEVGPKSQAVYDVMAVAYGAIGAHNYYAGRWKRGLAQTLITVLTLGLGLFISYIWAVINIFTIKTDGKGRLLIPSKPAKITCGILCPIIFLFFMGPLVIGGIAGYTLSMNRYRANEILNYAAVLNVTQSTKNTYEPIACSELVPGFQLPKIGRCIVHPDGAIQLSGVDKTLVQALVINSKGKAHPMGPNEVVIRFTSY